MLTYLGTGERRYHDRPVLPIRRRWWEFQAVVAGRCGPLLPGRPTTLSRRRLWVSPPGHMHGWIGTRGEACEVVVFQFDAAPELLRQEAARRESWSVELTAADAQRLRRLAEQLAVEHRRPTALSELRFDAALLTLSTLALRHLEDAPPPSPADAARRKVEAALAWYVEHMSAGAGVDDVARAVSVSPSHLRRLFHHARNESPLRAMRRLQVQRATDLLEQSDLPVKVVAEACGFSAVSVFSRAFKAEAGVAPSVWRTRSFAPRHPRYTSPP